MIRKVNEDDNEEVDDGIEYPSSDGIPVGESDLHLAALIILRELLRWYYRDQDVYVANDMFLYYERGNPRATNAPDVMVIKGVPQRDRVTFLTWREGNAVPCVIIEITSEKTWKEDLFVKPAVYASIGVKEYFFFDPNRKYLKPSVHGFRLEQGAYAPIPRESKGALMSTELGLLLGRKDKTLRLADPETGKLLRTAREEQLFASARAEKEAARRKKQWRITKRERERAKQESERADQATERANLASERADQQHERAEQALEQARVERKLKESERRRAEELAAELQRLRAELASKPARDA